MSVPYEELLMEPNRTPAERLGAIVGRRFIFSREQWPAWQRLVDRFSWPVVIRAADSCDPSKRFPNNVEAKCQQFAKDEAELATAQPPPRVAMTKEERASKAAEFQRIRNQVMEAP